MVKIGFRILYIQEFLNIAIAQSNIHNKVLDISGSKQEVLTKVLCALQTTKHEILYGIDKLKSGDVKQGVVTKDSVQQLRVNILKSTNYFIMVEDLIKNDVNVNKIHKELIEIHKEFVQLIRSLIINKEVLE